MLTASSIKHRDRDAGYPYDQETLDDLRLSHSIDGPKKPIIIARSKDKDINGKVIEGRHRRFINPTWPAEFVQVEDWHEFYRLRFTYNIQHGKNKQQIEFDLKQYCELYEQMGFPLNEISARVLKQLEGLHTGYNPDYLRSLIPARYKDAVKSDAGTKGKQAQASEMTKNLGSSSAIGAIPQSFISFDSVEKGQAVVREVWGMYQDAQLKLSKFESSPMGKRFNKPIEVACPKCSHKFLPETS